jgi:hypothetical protein
MPRSLAAKIRAANTALLAEGNVDAVGEFFTTDYVAHATGRDMAGGHGAIRRFVTALQRAFPDLHVDVEVLVEGKDAYKGFAASGRRIVWRDMVTSRFRGGRIAEDWVITDLAERLLRARKR